MPLTLKNYAAELPEKLIALATKDIVRECDETEKGSFVAYVDEGKDSYDVWLKTVTGGAIKQFGCDCANNTSICRHVIALLIHVANGKKAAATVKIGKNKAKSQVATLLEEADAEQLRAFVQSLMNKNKDIELAFIHTFSAHEKHYTQAEVTSIMNDAVKAVGIKKNIDATQLKKLVELWAQTLAPVVKQYEMNVAGKEGFDAFHLIIENCLRFHLNIKGSSNKIIKFIEGLLLASANTIGALQNMEAWHKAMSYFIDAIPDGSNNVRMHYLYHIDNILADTDDKYRLPILDLLAAQYKNTMVEQLLNKAQYNKTMFVILERYDQLERYIDIFQPARYENEFNLRLIQALIAQQRFDIAKKFCIGQIQGNYRDEYNVPYWLLLKQIYTSQNDTTELLKVLSELMPYTFSFDDYLVISASMDEEEQKKWRTKILSRASNAARNNSAAGEFCFSLMAHDKKYKKMIDYIESFTPYSTIITYFEPMVMADKNQFLKTLARHTYDYGYYGLSGKRQDEQVNSLPLLYEKIRKHYTADFLKMYIAQEEKSTFYRTNRLLDYIKKKLSEEG